MVKVLDGKILIVDMEMTVIRNFIESTEFIETESKWWILITSLQKS